jgi:hypothetical protein
MPSRILREGIIESTAVSALSDSGELLYRHLMSVVDDYGRFTANPEVIRARCFPLQLGRWPLSRVREALAEISTMRTDDDHALVDLYQVGGRMFLQLNNFQQRVRTPSKFPQPSDGTPAVICRSDDGQMTASRARPRSDFVFRISDANANAESDVSERAPKTTASDPPPKKEPRPIREERTVRETIIAATSERMYSLHPKKRNLPLVAVALTAEVKDEPEPGALLREIEECHAAWCSSADWTKEGGRYVPKLDEWIADRGYTRWPPGHARNQPPPKPLRTYVEPKPPKEPEPEGSANDERTTTVQYRH